MIVIDGHLNYRDDARSMHTIVRVAGADGQDEIMFDNLTSAIELVAKLDLPIVEETIVRVPFGEGTPEWAVKWREVASGDPTETLLIVVEGDPDVLKGVTI